MKNENSIISKKNYLISLKRFLILLFLVLFFSCKKEVKEDIIIDKEVENTFLTSSFGKNSIFLSENKLDSTVVRLFANPENSENKYFYSDTLFTITISKYKLKNGEFESIKTEKIIENHWNYLDIDSSSIKEIKIKETPFLYFCAMDSFMGNAVLDKTVTFYLINLMDFSMNTLVYSGRNSFRCNECIYGEFIYDKNSNKLYLETLLNLSKETNFIYHKSKEEEDNPFHYLNYETKWNKDNNQENSYGAGYSEIDTSIKTTYYKTNLFHLNQGSTADSISNENYTVVSYFNSNLIGFDKSKKLYFPIFIESCVNFCSKEIEFISNDSLSVKYESIESKTIIPLKEIEFNETIGN